MANVVSKHVTVTTAGGAVALSTGNLVPGTYRIKAGPTTGLLYVGNDGAGDVTSSNGYVLQQYDSVKLTLQDPTAIYVDSSLDGKYAAVILVEGENIGARTPAA